MFTEFFQTWELFYPAYVTGWLIAFGLPVLGFWVVAREKAFAGAAIAQCSTAGVSLGLYLGALVESGRLPWLRNWDFFTGGGQDPLALIELSGGGELPSHPFLAAAAMAFAIAAALLFSGTLLRRFKGGNAAVALSFLLSGSLTVLLAAKNPHGMEEINRLSYSSLIGTEPSEIKYFTFFAAASLLLFLPLARRFLLHCLDPLTARIMGLRARVWENLLSVFLGMALGYAIQASGMIYAFGCLVLPPLTTNRLFRTSLVSLRAAPLAGVLTAVTGFVLANHWDFPPGQFTVALMGALAVLSYLRPAAASGRPAGVPPSGTDGPDGHAGRCE